MREMYGRGFFAFFKRFFTFLGKIRGTLRGLAHYTEKKCMKTDKRMHGSFFGFLLQ